MQQPVGAKLKPLKNVAHHGEIVAAGIGDDQTVPLALEELKPELDLQRLDLMAHGALRHAELFGGARKALVPGCGIERPQRV